MSDQFQVGDTIRAHCAGNNGEFFAITGEIHKIFESGAIEIDTSFGIFHPRQCELIERKKPEPKYVKKTKYQAVRLDISRENDGTLFPGIPLYESVEAAMQSQPQFSNHETIGYAPIEVFIKEQE